MTSGGNNFNYIPENRLTKLNFVPQLLIFGPLRITVTHFASPGVPLDAPGPLKPARGLAYGCHAKIFWVSQIPPPLLPFRPLYFSFPFPFFPLSLSLRLELDSSNTVRGLGKRCKLLKPRGSGTESPSGKRIWCILALKSDMVAPIVAN